VDNLWDTPHRPVRPFPPSPAALTLRVVSGPSGNTVFEGELFTAQQVADLLHVGRSTVDDWRRDGALSALPLPNGRYRYPSTDPLIAAALRAVRGRR
jgi:hypothetical protein